MATFTNISKNTAIWDFKGDSVLLQESGFSLLLETSVLQDSKILLEKSSGTVTSWTNKTKN